MTKTKAIYFLIFSAVALTSCGQVKNERTILGKAYAEAALKIALTDTSKHNIIDNKTILIKDSITAISVAEPVLFSIYGKENISGQRPYEVYLINNYWVIAGTLPKDSLGGTFLIILDSRNCEIIKITHGK